MPKIKVNDIHLYYETIGTGEPLVLIAPFASDHTIWQSVMQTFAKKYQVISFDNRGSGQSDCPDVPYTMDIFAQDTVALCAALDIQRANFIGASMGGMILQTICHQYSQFVKAAVLENSNIKMDFRFAIFSHAKYKLMEANAPRAALIESTLPWIFSTGFLQQADMVKTLVKLNLENPYPMTVTGYKNQSHAVAKFNAEPWIKNISTPCLVTGADKDIIFDPAEISVWAKLIPQAKYYQFHNAGHFPHIEQADVFCELVLKFLTTLSIE